MKRKHLFTTMAALLGAFAVVLCAYAQEGCDTIQQEDCVSGGCTETYQGNQYSGTITSAKQLGFCEYGSPGNLYCTPDSTKSKQICTYTCTITVNGTKIPLSDQQTQGYPVKLSGPTC
jgi:hypothetical protein